MLLQDDSLLRGWRRSRLGPWRARPRWQTTSTTPGLRSTSSVPTPADKFEWWVECVISYVAWFTSQLAITVKIFHIISVTRCIFVCALIETGSHGTSAALTDPGVTWLKTINIYFIEIQGRLAFSQQNMFLTHSVSEADNWIKGILQGHLIS